MNDELTQAIKMMRGAGIVLVLVGLSVIGWSIVLSNPDIWDQEWYNDQVPREERWRNCIFTGYIHPEQFLNPPKDVNDCATGKEVVQFLGNLTSTFGYIVITVGGLMLSGIIPRIIWHFTKEKR